MNKNTKIILGILSIIPLIGLILYMYTFFSHIMQDMLTMGNERMDPEESIEFIQGFFTSMIIGGIAMVLGMILMVIFIVFAIKDSSAKENDQLLWVLMLIFLNIIALPVYWYVRIWSNPDFAFEKKFTEREN